MNFTMMKFRAMMLCLLVMLFAGSLISCSSDDDDSPKEKLLRRIPRCQLQEQPCFTLRRLKVICSYVM